MLTLTCPIETRWHPVPAGAKLIGLAVATLLVVALRTPLAVSAGLVVAALVYLAEGVGFARHGLRMLRPLWPFVAVLAIWHGVTGALADGVVIGARMLTAVALANLVTMTTRLDDMIAVVERAEKYGRLGDAWKARCARRANWRLVLPGLLVALDDADHVAEALRARGGL
jgi:biotin transport system permease protein